MDKILTQQVGQLLNVYYKEITKTLLDTDSYYQNVRINNISKYLSFVNSALDQNYARIVHIRNFIADYDSLSSMMYPFQFLQDSAKEHIDRIYSIAGWLMDGLESCDKEGAKFLGY